MNADNRRRNIQIILTIIIMATIPFYCIGFALFAFAPQSSSSPLPTNTPNTILPTSDVSGTATLTSLPGETQVLPTDSPFTQIVPTNPAPSTLRPLSPTPLLPTATQFIPPTQPPLPTGTPVPQPTPTTLPFFPTDNETPNAP